MLLQHFDCVRMFSDDSIIFFVRLSVRMDLSEWARDRLIVYHSNLLATFILLLFIWINEHDDSQWYIVSITDTNHKISRELHSTTRRFDFFSHDIGYCFMSYSVSLETNLVEQKIGNWKHSKNQCFNNSPKKWHHHCFFFNDDIKIPKWSGFSRWFSIQLLVIIPFSIALINWL